MTMHQTTSILFLIIVILILPISVFSDQSMGYIYNAPETKSDVRYNYQWEVLRNALDITTDSFGPYQMVASEPMTEDRQMHELAAATGKLTVMYLDTTRAREQVAIPVRIPVDKGLVGYRVFLIRQEDQPKFAAIHSLDDLRQYSYGLGVDWTDVELMKENGFSVVTGSNYDGLFEMLIHKRFEVFSRGVNEILGEYDQYKKALPALHVEENLLLYYPQPMYFWFAKTVEGERLAARVESGLWQMIEDGTLDRIFRKHFDTTIKQLRLGQRKIFHINNPFLVPETLLDDKQLWFNPEQY